MKVKAYLAPNIEDGGTVAVLSLDQEAADALEAEAAALGMTWEAVVEHALLMYLSDEKEMEGGVDDGASRGRAAPDGQGP